VIAKKNHAQCFCFATTFVCVIANIDGNFVIAKKCLNSVCLQLFCVRDCNPKLFVVAT
jgi:hypothetical protein